jgi:hypothetical protein
MARLIRRRTAPFPNTAGTRSLAGLLALLLLIATSASASHWTSTGPEGGDVGAIAIDASSPQTVYVGMYNDSGLYKSSDGGASWSRSSNGLPPSGSYSIEAVAINPQAPSGVYLATSLGVYRSTGAGGNWSSLGPSGQYVRSLALNPQTPTTIYAGTLGGGVFKSTNGGVGGSWTLANNGLTDLTVWALAVDPITTSTVYAGTSAGVFKSVDAGANWTSVGLVTSGVFVFALDPASPSTLYPRLACSARRHDSIRGARAGARRPPAEHGTGPRCLWTRGVL